MEVFDLVLLAPVGARNELRIAKFQALLFRYKSILIHPVIVEMLGHVISDGVWEDDNHSLAFSNVKVFDCHQGASKCCA